LRLVIRVDASRTIGIGHVMRCLTLADAAAARGARARFVCRHLPDALRELLGARGHEVTILDAAQSARDDDELPHAYFLGVPQAEDAAATRDALGSNEFDWLIVDHYGIDARWESTLRARVRHIFVIDDVADRRHDCDVLLDQNVYPDMGARYAAHVASDCEQLLGPRFALLRPEFRTLRSSVSPRTGAVRRVFILFGGADPHDLTGRALMALRELGPDAPIADVVIGAQHPRISEIQAQCAQAGHACYVQSDRVAEIMARADLALGAGGSTSWERCCLGLATICASFADNQYHIAHALEATGACVFLGDQSSVTSASIRHAIAALMSDPKRLETMSRCAYDLVDGNGAGRVCDVLAERL
jgi:UDP-2,4-diacetamido-2,4,6-trideoxy-beta-L-altropyranose hydrolase